MLRKLIGLILLALILRECTLYLRGGPNMFRLIDPHPITCRPHKKWAWDCVPLGRVQGAR